MADPAQQIRELQQQFAALEARLGPPPAPVDPQLQLQHAEAAAQRAAEQAERAAELRTYFRDLAVKHARFAPTTSADHSLATAGELSHFATNPIPRPAAVSGVEKIFYIQQTAWGQDRAAKLASTSGFSLEVAAWAPLVSYLSTPSAPTFCCLAPQIPQTTSELLSRE